jgi:hypothetical protein
MADKLKQLEMLKSQYVPTTEFYSQIIDSLQDYSIFTLDTELKLIVELWFCLHLRYEAEEVLGEDFDVIFTNKDKANGILIKKLTKH